jgi:hypothetical protein
VRGLRALAASRKGRILVATAGGYLLWQAWLTVRAPAKLAPVLRAAGTARVDILVTLPFPPERFHVLAFQKHGRVSGTQGDQIELRGVRRVDLKSVARPYWVRAIDPLPTGREP